ncbi:MAG TPA: hypothetical protein VI027_12645 [Rubrobacteraceae bacterium]
MRFPEEFSRGFALRSPYVLRGVEPGLRNVAVVLQPGPDPLALVPVAKLHPVALDLAQKLRVVRQPHVLERVQVTAAHALEHGAEVDPLDLDMPVTKVLL